MLRYLLSFFFVFLNILIMVYLNVDGSCCLQELKADLITTKAGMEYMQMKYSEDINLLGNISKLSKFW